MNAEVLIELTNRLDTLLEAKSLELDEQKEAANIISELYKHYSAVWEKEGSKGSKTNRINRSLNFIEVIEEISKKLQDKSDQEKVNAVKETLLKEICFRLKSFFTADIDDIEEHIKIYQKVIPLFQKMFSSEDLKNHFFNYIKFQDLDHERKMQIGNFFYQVGHKLKSNGDTYNAAIAYQLGNNFGPLYVVWNLAGVQDKSYLVDVETVPESPADYNSMSEADRVELIEALVADLENESDEIAYCSCLALGNALYQYTIPKYTKFQFETSLDFLEKIGNLRARLEGNAERVKNLDRMEQLVLHKIVDRVVATVLNDPKKAPDMIYSILKRNKINISFIFEALQRRVKLRDINKDQTLQLADCVASAAFKLDKKQVQDDDANFKANEFAANLGNRTAMWSLARCYTNGTGVSKNLVLAVEWYRQCYLKYDKNITKNSRGLIGNLFLIIKDKDPEASFQACLLANDILQNTKSHDHAWHLEEIINFIPILENAEHNFADDPIKLKEISEIKKRMFDKFIQLVLNLSYDQVLFAQHEKLNSFLMSSIKANRFSPQQKMELANSINSVANSLLDTNKELAYRAYHLSAALGNTNSIVFLISIYAAGDRSIEKDIGKVVEYCQKGYPLCTSETDKKNVINVLNKIAQPGIKEFKETGENALPVRIKALLTLSTIYFEEAKNKKDLKLFKEAISCLNSVSSLLSKGALLAPDSHAILIKSLELLQASSFRLVSREEAEKSKMLFLQVVKHLQPAMEGFLSAEEHLKASQLLYDQCQLIKDPSEYSEIVNTALQHALLAQSLFEERVQQQVGSSLSLDDGSDAALKQLKQSIAGHLYLLKKALELPGELKELKNAEQLLEQSGVLKLTPEQAKKVFENIKFAAEVKGDLSAMHKLWRCYDQGIGTEKNPERAHEVAAEINLWSIRNNMLNMKPQDILKTMRIWQATHPLTDQHIQILGEILHRVPELKRSNSYKHNISELQTVCQQLLTEHAKAVHANRDLAQAILDREAVRKVASSFLTLDKSKIKQLAAQDNLSALIYLARSRKKKDPAALCLYLKIAVLTGDPQAASRRFQLPSSEVAQMHQEALACLNLWVSDKQNRQLSELARHNIERLNTPATLNMKESTDRFITAGLSPELAATYTKGIGTVYKAQTQQTTPTQPQAVEEKKSSFIFRR